MSSEIEIKFAAEVEAAKAKIDELNQSLGKTGETADKVSGKTGGAGGTKNLGGSFLTLAGNALAAVGGTAALGAAFKHVVDAASEAETANARLEGMLRATGGSSGQTMESLDRLAASMSRLSGMDDQVIKGAEAVLLRFTNIQEQFPQATQATLDLAAALGTGENGLAQSAQLVGRVLSGPEGLGALQRYGVVLTSTEKEKARALYETGQMAEYQAYALEQLNQRIGGMAEIMGDTYAGKMNHLKTTMGGISEAIGNLFLPTLTRAADGALTLLTWGEQLNAAYQQQSGDILALSNSYEEYIDMQLSAADAAGKLGQFHIQSAEQIQGNQKAVEHVIQALGLLSSESEWTAAKSQDAFKQMIQAAQDEEAALQEVNFAMDNLALFMAGPMGEESERFRLRQVEIHDALNETQKRINELQSKSWLPPSKREELDNLLDQQGELQTAFKQNAEAHDQAQKAIVFGMLQQQMASDGLTKTEVDNLAEVAASWGLIDKSTKMAYDAVSDYLDQLGGAKAVAADLQKIIDAIPDQKNIRFTFSGIGLDFGGGYTKQSSGIYTQSMGIVTTGIQGINATGGTGINTDFHPATGLSYIVPRGYPGDSATIRAQTGEHVQITPAGKTQDSLGSVINALNNLPSAIAVAVRDGMLMGSA